MTVAADHAAEIAALVSVDHGRLLDKAPVPISLLFEVRCGRCSGPARAPSTCFQPRSVKKR